MARIEGIRFENNPLLYIDATSETYQYDSPFILLIVGNTTISAVFRYSFNETGVKTNSKSTISAVTSVNSADNSPKISSFDIIVNGTIVSRRRYGNPGVAKEQAFSDANNLLHENIYKQLKDILDTNSASKMTTLSTFPKAGDTANIDIIKSVTHSDAIRKEYYNL
jgi:hypothetical protein